MINNNRIDRLVIDEEEERLKRFFEIFLKADLRTIERLENNNGNKNSLTNVDNKLK